MSNPSHPAAVEGFSAGPPQGKSAPSGGSAAHAVASVGALALDAEALYRELLRGVRSMLTPTTHLAGIASGGAWLAERLQKDLGLEGPAGVLSSVMHRDDFAQRGLSAGAQTSLPFDVNGADVLVLDDVLYTGRTIRETGSAARPLGVGLGGAVALVHLEDLQTTAAAQLAAKLERALGVLVARAVGVVGHTDHQGVGLPLLDAQRDLHKTGIALGLDGGLRRSAFQHAVARGHARALLAKIKSKKGLEVRGNGGLLDGLAMNGHAGHACPASGDSIQAFRPSSARARS